MCAHMRQLETGRSNGMCVSVCVCAYVGGACVYSHVDLQIFETLMARCQQLRRNRIQQQSGDLVEDLHPELP